MQHPHPVGFAKMVGLLVCCCGDKVSAALRQLVSGGVRPSCPGFRHACKMPAARCRVKPAFLFGAPVERTLALLDDRKSGGGPPHSKTLPRYRGRPVPREASWSAPDLWRFGMRPTGAGRSPLDYWVFSTAVRSISQFQSTRPPASNGVGFHMYRTGCCWRHLWISECPSAKLSPPAPLW